MLDHDRIKELIPFYALGTVTPEEAASVRPHLDECDRCVEDLDLHLTTAAALERDRTPPAGVWPRVESQINERSQTATVSYPSERRSRRALSALVGVAAALALVFAGFIIARLTDWVPPGDGTVIAAAQVAADQTGSIVTEFLVDDTSVARMILSEDGRGYVVPTESLPALDDSQTYQLWVINSDEAVISAGILGNDPAPATFTWKGEVSGLALTREIAGGVVASEGELISAVTDLS